MWDEAFELIANGSYIKGPKLVYDTVMGVWWIFLLFMISIYVIYYVTDNEGVAAIWGIIGSIVLLAYGDLPITLQPMVYLVIVICLGIFLYRIFGKE